ncbi:MAG: succinate CoA transferase [Oscillospiraceae bacterium]|nr:succinate CoA transferase [Oscillospiraceae bacterium]
MAYSDRLRCEELKDRLMSADAAAALIDSGMTVAVSGFTPAGCPKAVPLALAEQVRSGKRKLRLTLLSGASTGEELDNAWAECGIIARRAPYMTSKALRAAVNGGAEEEIAYTDVHLGEFAQNARCGFNGKIDVALIEAAAITEEGDIVPTTALGCSQTWIDLAERVIVELNETQPAALEGFHDVFRVGDPPRREPIPLTAPGQRIGRPYLSCPKEKIAAVVVCACEEKPRPFPPADAVSEAIARNIVRFLLLEKDSGRLSADRVPLQSGVGAVANAVLIGLKDSPLEHLSFYSEVMQDGILDLIDAGKADFASATSLSLSRAGLERLFADIERYRGKLVLRDSEISNSAEVIRRLGVIAMNTAVEADLYGNVNSSQMNGTTVYNGIGGSGDYARSALISIFMTPSVAKGGKISCIVPMVTHVDHSEHDVDVLVTEQGWADLRGLSPKERARLIIENCAHPDYRAALRAYFDEACAATHGAQTPHILSESFRFHENLAREGSMRRETKGETLC